jgi:DNA-binding MarR family transcriptional regulator
MPASAPPSGPDRGARPANLGNPRNILDFLVYRLHLPYSIVSTHVTGIYEGAYGITRQEWYVLALMAALGEMSPTQLAEVSEMSLPLTSRTLRSLREKKLVSRDTLEGDKRFAHIRLTSTGVALYKEVYREAANYNLAVVSVLSEQEQSQLAELLEKLHKRALEIEGESQSIGSINRRAGGTRVHWDR